MVRVDLNFWFYVELTNLRYDFLHFCSLGQCFNFSVLVKKNLIQDAILENVKLKTLGNDVYLPCRQN